MRTAVASEPVSASVGTELLYVGCAEQSCDLRAAVEKLLIVLRSLVVEDPLLNLVAARAAQLNHCALTLAVHIELAKRQGEHPMRLYHLSAWRDSNLFGPRERAALEWAEMLSASPVPADLKPADKRTDIGMSAKDVSTVGFVVAVVNLSGRLQFTPAAVQRGMPPNIDPRPSYGTTNPYVR